MRGDRTRSSLAVFVLLCAVIVGLSLMAGGCDPQASGVKETVNAYYDAIGRGDKDAEVALWMPDRQDEAQAQANAWASRDRQGLKLDEVHVDSGPAGDQRIVHVTLSIDDKARPGRRRYETKTLLMQQQGDRWLIRDER